MECLTWPIPCTLLPVFSHGMQLIVDPNLDAMPGDDVVVTLAGFAAACIMRLVSIDAAEVIGRQFNPDGILRFDRSEVISVDPVVFCRHRQHKRMAARAAGA